MAISYRDRFVRELRRYMVDINWVGTDALRLDKLDVEEFVRLQAEAGVNRIVLFFKDHWGYSMYDTKVGIKHPYVKGDLCAEVIKQAEKHCIGIIGYYSVGFDHVIVEKHPDWSMKDVNGKPVALQYQPDFKLFNMPCYNSPYREYVLDQLSEIAENYSIHHVSIDILGRMTAAKDYSGSHGCYCEHCKRIYQKVFGREIPTEADWSEEWKRQVNWRLDYVMKFYQNMVDVVQSKKPGLPVTRNNGPLRTWQASWTHAQRARLVSGEEFVECEDGGPNTGKVGHMCVLSRSLTDGRVGSFELAFQYPITDAISTNRFKLECLNILAHGGAPVAVAMAGSIYADGKLEKRSLEMLSPVYHEIAEKEGFILGASFIPYIGIIFSDSTRIFYGREDNHNRYGASMEGAIKVLFDLHLPFDVVAEWNITPQNLRRFSMIVLPNVAALSREQVDVLRSYVKEGGRLLGTFESSLFDETGERLGNYQLADVFGLSYLARSDQEEGVVNFLPSTYLAKRNNKIFAGLPDTNLQLTGPFILTEASSGDTAAYHQLPVKVSFRDKKVSWGDFPNDLTQYPAIHLNEYGKGKVAFVTTQIFRECTPFPLPGFFSVYTPPHGLWWRRKLISNILKWLDPDPPIYVEAPDTIEATFLRHDERNQVIIQLVNRTNWDHVVPIENIEVLVRRDMIKPKEVYIPPKRRELTASQSGSYLKITVPRTELHEMIILQL
ncbi:MAG: alpha-L-fucosidase [Candidatus Bathyarchaeia archaeon]